MISTSPTQQQIDKIASGKQARQDGENAKNRLAANLSYFTNKLNYMSPESTQYLQSVNINPSSVLSMESTSLQDGLLKCKKPDIKLVITYLYQGEKTIITHLLSVKSTFKETQVAIHSLASLDKHTLNQVAIIPQTAKELLYHFSAADTQYINNPILFPNKPTHLFPENLRRDRYCINEINAFNPQLIIDFSDYLKNNAEKFLLFLISKGEATQLKDIATHIVFCDKKGCNILVKNIHDIVQHYIKESTANNSWCIPGRDKKISGITTLSLFNGLIKLQMKGNGDKSKTTFHQLQFRITGKNLHKI